jgi:hypothetical protein
VKCSPALKWALAPLLVLTLSWKLALRPDEHSSLVNDAIVKFLAQHQFSVVVTNDIINENPVIRASSGGCRLLVAKILPLRDSIDQIQYLTKMSDRTFIVFRGIIYTKQPVLLTAASYLWFRLIGSLGLVSRIPPVLAVVTSCNAEQLPWNALSFI